MQYLAPSGAFRTMHEHDPLAGAVMKDGRDPFMQTGEMEQELMDLAVSQRWSRIVETEITPYIKPLISTNPLSGAHEEARAHVAFAIWEFSRLKHLDAPTQFPWEQAWLKDHHAAAWTPELLKEAPNQYEMAQEYFANLLFPQKALDLMDQLSISSKEKISVQNVSELLKNSATQYIQTLPTEMVITAGLEAAATVLVNVPENTLITSALYPFASVAKAQISARAYNFANEMRTVKEALVPVLQDFLDVPFRQQVLSGKSDFAQLNPTDIAARGLTRSIDEHSFTSSLLRLQSSFIGTDLGGLIASLMQKSVYPLFYTQAAHQAGLSLRDFAVRRAEVYKNILLKEHTRVLEVAREFIDLPFNASEDDVDEVWTRFNDARDARNKSLLTTNISAKKQEVLFRSSPVAIFAVLARFNLPGISRYTSPAAFTMSTIASLVTESSSMLVMKDMNEAEAVRQQAQLINALEYLRSHMGELDLPSSGTDGGPLPETIVLHSNMMRDMQSAPIFPEIIIESGVTVLKGGTGTGKSTVIDAIAGIHAYHRYADITDINGTNLEQQYAPDVWSDKVTTVSVHGIFGRTLASELGRKMLAGKSVGIIEELQKMHDAEMGMNKKQMYQNIMHLLQGGKTPELSALLVQWNTFIEKGGVANDQTAGAVAVLNEAITNYLSRYFNPEEYQRIPSLLQITFTSHAQVSTGQRARVGLALSLLSNAEIYMFDEVTGNLDQKTTVMITKLLLEYVQTHPDAKFIMAIHDLTLLQAVRNSGYNRIYDFDSARVIEKRKDIREMISHIESNIVSRDAEVLFEEHAIAQWERGMMDALEIWNNHPFEEDATTYMLSELARLQRLFSSEGYIDAKNAMPLDERRTDLVEPVRRVMNRLSEVLITPERWNSLTGVKAVPLTTPQICDLYYILRRSTAVVNALKHRISFPIRDEITFTWDTLLKARFFPHIKGVPPVKGVAKYTSTSLMNTDQYEQALRSLLLENIEGLWMNGSTLQREQFKKNGLSDFHFLYGLKKFPMNTSTERIYTRLGKRFSRLLVLGSLAYSHSRIPYFYKNEFHIAVEKVVDTIKSLYFPTYSRPQTTEWMAGWIAGESPLLQKVLVREMEEDSRLENLYCTLLHQLEEFTQE